MSEVMLVFVMMVLHFSICDGSLISVPSAVGDTSSVCPNMNVIFTCTIADLGDNITVWTAESSIHSRCTVILEHEAIAENIACGSPSLLAFSNISDPAVSTMRFSTTTSSITPIPDGYTVSCFAGFSNRMLVGSISVCVIGELLMGY